MKNIMVYEKLIFLFNISKNHYPIVIDTKLVSAIKHSILSIFEHSY